MVYTTEQIMAIASDGEISKDERITQLLMLGIEELDLALGIVSNIQGNRYKVMYTNNPDLQGQEFRTGNTYCSITLTLKQERVLPVKHFAVSEHFRHPAYAEFKLEAYIGTPIHVDGKPYGTLNFTKPNPRDESFTKDDEQLVTMLADAIGNVLEEA